MPIKLIVNPYGHNSILIQEGESQQLALFDTLRGALCFYNQMFDDQPVFIAASDGTLLGYDYHGSRFILKHRGSQLLQMEEKEVEFSNRLHWLILGDECRQLLRYSEQA